MDQKTKQLLFGFLCFALICTAVYFAFFKEKDTGYDKDETKQDNDSVSINDKFKDVVDKITQSEDFVGQKRKSIPIPRSLSDKNRDRYSVATNTQNEDDCKRKKAEIMRICSPVVAQSVNDEVSQLDYFCAFTFKCSADIVNSGQLDDIVPPSDIEKTGIAYIEGAVNGAWGLDRVDQEKLPLNDNYDSQFNGQGQVVYVVDTGINESHEEWGDRYLGMKDYTGEGKGDGNGHGTHCSGSAVGTKYGVAKGALLYGVRVLGSGGSGDTGDVVDGIVYAANDWKKNHQGKGRGCVISMSLGGGKNSAMNRAATNASNSGCIVVVASGNQNSNACNYSPASAGGNGRQGNVVTVNSTTKSDNRSSFSNFGPCTDIFAPGTDIKSAWIPGSTSTRTISGTSMATPHVAGAFAMALQKTSGNKMEAIKEIFGIGTMGVVKDGKEGSPNQLLRVPFNGDPPGEIPNPPKPLEVDLEFGSGKDKVALNDDVFYTSSFGPTFGDFLNESLGNNANIDVVDLREWEAGPDEGKADLACMDRTALVGPGFNSEPTFLSGKIVLVDRGDCGFYDKVMVLQDRGAAMVIIAQNSNAVPFAPGTNEDESKIKIPSGMISRSNGNKIRALIKKGTKALLKVTDPN